MEYGQTRPVMFAGKIRTQQMFRKGAGLDKQLQIHGKKNLDLSLRVGVLVILIVKELEFKLMMKDLTQKGLERT
jgi:hypothetical protein